MCGCLLLDKDKDSLAHVLSKNHCFLFLQGSALVSDDPTVSEMVYNDWFTIYLMLKIIDKENIESKTTWIK